jgi:hypothetical protein
MAIASFLLTANMIVEQIPAWKLMATYKPYGGFLNALVSDTISFPFFWLWIVSMIFYLLLSYFKKKGKQMIYRPTIFNVLAALIVLNIVWQFINIQIQLKEHPEIHRDVMTFFLIIYLNAISGIILFFSDIVIQLIKNSKEAIWVLVIEGNLILLILIFYWSRLPYLIGMNL